MDIIAVKANSDCFRKAVIGLDANSEALVRKTLRIKGDPSSCGFTDIQEGKQLKDAMAKLDTEPSIQSCYPMRHVRQYINALDDADQVVLLDGQRYSNYDILCWNNALVAYKEGQNPVQVYHAYRYDIPDRYFPRHDIFFFADLGYDQFYGEQDKNKRVCRFCETNDPKAFGDPKNSHAISWFLGNNALYCLEECKKCNNDFGSTIENALSSYYQYYRAAEHRKSRKGNPLTAKGFNYETKADGGLHIFQQLPIENSPRVGEKLPDEGLLVHLHNSDPVVLHYIYRVLCKYVIACLPSELMPAFRDTVKWIRGEKHPHKGVLPPVYRVETLDEVKKPSLCVYIRRDAKKDLPFCIGELRFMGNLYVYALPYCKGHDVMNSQLAAPLSRFVATRYPGQIFTVENYCDDEPKMIINHVKIEGDGNEVMQPLTEEQIAQAEAAYRSIPPEKRM